ncbi:MAG: hypothetical protein HY927_15105 [Elusimicrobia bacterium]|nr:hypothetical protein [Elusimicrobiota bacterium]
MEPRRRLRPGRRSLAALGLAVLCAWPAPARAARYTVAVMPFENLTKDAALDWLTMGIPETITNDLMNIAELALVERLQLRRVLDEQKLQAGGAIDPSTAVRVGKLIGAGILVIGGFQKHDETIRLTSRFVDVETGGVLQTAMATGKLSDIFDLQDQVVKSLAKDLDISLKKAELAKLAERPTESLEAYRHFGQGALLQSRKDLTGAVSELEQAAALDPGFKAAREKFKEVFWSLNAGNYWTYRMSDGTETVELTRHAGGLESFAGQDVFSYYERPRKDGVELDKKTVTTYYAKAEDGIHEAGTTIIVEAKGSSTSVSAQDVPMPMVFPYAYRKDAGWKNEFSRKVFIGGRFRGGSAIAEEYRMTGEESVTVPAGTFKAQVFEKTSAATRKGDDGTETTSRTSSSFWFTPGIGYVKERENGSDGDVVEVVLTEYHID